MNLEDLKKSLIEMIDEANYLEDNELVEIPEVNVKVKKGRKEEFLNMYGDIEMLKYELEVRKVFDLLAKENEKKQ